ncbi:HAD-IA family hydrolase [Brevibacterium otitidis]
MQLTCQAILFDIDGTLVDSTSAIERIWRTWADEYGLRADEILATSHGRRSEEVLREHLPAGQIPAAHARLLEIERSAAGETRALPGTCELLGQLLDGTWATVTSGKRAVMESRLHVAGLPVPEVFVAADDVTVGKPDPEGYLAAARALGVDPRACLVIEDAPAGVRAGLAAGAHVLAVGTSHPLSALGEAHACVPDLTACSMTVGDAGITVEIRS